MALRCGKIASALRCGNARDCSSENSWTVQWTQKVLVCPVDHDVPISIVHRRTLNVLRGESENTRWPGRGSAAAVVCVPAKRSVLARASCTYSFCQVIERQREQLCGALVFGYWQFCGLAVFLGWQFF
ncbi:MAG: hypothetical protein CMO44_10580 [Verrucomicrobiales bacterium]|nr:hypothetical protein [Verrucomicrobiales bacterium]